MTFAQFFATLRARWKIALATLLLIVGVTAAVNLLLPARYTAISTVVVDGKPDPVSSMWYGGGPSPAYLATQINVIESERVAARVVQSLKLAEAPLMRQRWLEATDGRGDIVVWIGKLLQQSLEVKPTKDSNVLQVSFDSPEPAFAAALANAFVQAYIDTTVEMRTDPAKQYSTFFDQRSKQARERLEAAQTKLSMLQKEKGLIASNERLDIESARLQELSSQLVALQALAVESNSRRAQANASPDAAGDVINNPLIASLRADLLRQETQLQELSQRLGSANPQVVELKTRIGSIRAKIATESRRISSSVDLSSRTNDTRVAEVRAALEAQREKIIKMREARDEAAVLEREVANAQAAFDQIQTRLTATSIESQANVSSLYVLSRAAEPTSPSGPKVVRNVAISIVVGLMLAVAAALARELFDRRVRTIDDLVSRLGLPVVGALPRPNAKRLFGKGRPSLLHAQPSTRLPRPRGA